MVKAKRSAKQRTITTIVVMTILALVIIGFYFYWSNRTAPLDEDKNLSETERLLQVDLNLYYPETPREVVKLFGGMMKSFYNDMVDADVEAMALKIRELYDDEFLANNPQEQYLNNLYTDIAKWKDSDRRITSFRLINEDMEQQDEIDGINYSIVYLSFTIQESVKFTESWKVMLRQDEDKRWKILGWQTYNDATIE